MTTFDITKQMAKQRGLSLKALNDKAGLGANAIYSWKTSKPGMDALNSVAKVLGVSVDYLLGNTDNPSQQASRDNNMPVDLEEVLAQLGPSVQFNGQELTDEQKLKLYEMAKIMFGE